MPPSLRRSLCTRGGRRTPRISESAFLSIHMIIRISVVSLFLLPSAPSGSPQNLFHDSRQPFRLRRVQDKSVHFICRPICRHDLLPIYKHRVFARLPAAVFSSILPSYLSRSVTDPASRPDPAARLWSHVPSLIPRPSSDSASRRCLPVHFRF